MPRSPLCLECCYTRDPRSAARSGGLRDSESSMVFVADALALTKKTYLEKRSWFHLFLKRVVATVGSRQAGPKGQTRTVQIRLNLGRDWARLHNTPQHTATHRNTSQHATHTTREHPYAQFAQHQPH